MTAPPRIVRPRRAPRPGRRVAIGIAGTAILVTAIGALAPRTAALPLYASREGRTCVACHHDPNGGGMRNETGFIYGRNRHGFDADTRWPEITVEPRLNDWLAIGMDTRVLYVASHRSSVRGLETSTFFPMQGQLHVSVMPHEYLTVVMSRGISTEGGSFLARELYGLIRGLPRDLYARVGRFRVPFGLRQDDHTSLVRRPEFLSYDSQALDAGIELGMAGPVYVAQASITDGGAAFTERAQTLAAKVWRGGRRIATGVSGYHKFQHFPGTSIPTSTDDRWALFALSTHGRLTVLGEAAGGTTSGAGGATNLYAAFAEVDCRLMRGVNARAKIDYLDRDREASEDLWRRVSLELDLVPVPFTELRLAARAHRDELGGDVDEYLALFYFPF